MSIESFEFWTILRLLVPLTILKWPLFGTILAALTDIKDHDYLLIEPFGDKFYQIWDKLLDTYYLTFTAFTTLRWKDRIAKRISILSFSYRVLGLIVFLITGIQGVLFFFPNFFESLFYFYPLFIKVTKEKILFVSKFWVALILVAILIPKVAQEYLIHVVKTPAVEFLGLREIPQLQKLVIPPLDVPYLIPVILYFTLPVLFLF